MSVNSLPALHNSNTVFSHSSLFGRAIACLNINSLSAHIDELRVFMDNSKVDILSINETKLDSSIMDSEIHLPGYDVVRLDRKLNGRNGGGVCIYLRSNLNFRTREDLISDDLEMLIVEIANPRSRPFLVGTWYRPPSSSQQIFTLFEEIIDRVDSENSELYLLGDLNCNLLSDTPNSNTSELLNIFETYNLSQTISEPARITNTSQTLIDLSITNTPDHTK